jgi:hypothetical protein
MNPMGQRAGGTALLTIDHINAHDLPAAVAGRRNGCGRDPAKRGFMRMSHFVSAASALILASVLALLDTAYDAIHAKGHSPDGGARSHPG